MTATGSSEALAGEAGWPAMAHRPEALQLEYCTPAQLQGRAPGSWRDVLGVVLYSEEPLQCAAPPDIPVVTVPGAALGPAPACVELWRLRIAPAGSEDGRVALRAGQCGSVRFRHGSSLAFASLAVAEAETETGTGAPAGSMPRGLALQRTTQRAYGELFRTLDQLGFAHPVRLWNYLPDLTGHCDGAQRYAHFNAGRQDAFLQARRRLSGEVPAASVLGLCRQAPLTVYGLAAREPPLPLENPRQCSAWDYPRQYSERRPTFARACIDRSGAARLFISGTASIVGHRSEHPGDAVAQTREILRNIRALLTAANERVGSCRFSEQALTYKIYVRDRQHHGAIERVLHEELGPAPPRLFVHAEVCRPELLIEIEATHV